MASQTQEKVLPEIEKGRGTQGTSKEDEKDVEDQNIFQPGKEERRRAQRKVNKERKLMLGETPQEQTRQFERKQTEASNDYERFKAIPYEHFKTGFHIVDALSKEKPHLSIRVRPNVNREVIITVLTKEAANTLAQLEILEGKPVSLEALNSENKIQRWIVTRFPHGMDLQCLISHKQIIEAERCTLHDRELKRRVETRQVLVKALGTFPNNTLDLGWYGTYFMRPYTSEPIRCFRCQRFGHHQNTCTNFFACALCAGRHRTEVCINKRKDDNISAEVKCPNCSKKHPAWSQNCSARRDAMREKMSRMPPRTENQNEERPTPPRLEDPVIFPVPQQARREVSNHEHQTLERPTPPRLEDPLDFITSLQPRRLTSQHEQQTEERPVPPKPDDATQFPAPQQPRLEASSAAPSRPQKAPLNIRQAWKSDPSKRLPMKINASTQTENSEKTTTQTTGTTKDTIYITPASLKAVLKGLMLIINL